MSTIGNLVDRARVRLGETTAREWSNADQLIPYASESERWMARFLNRLPKSKRFCHRQTFTLAANTETFDLTTLAKRFDWLISLAVQVSNVWVPVAQYEDDDEQPLSNLSLGGGTIVPAVSIADDTLVFEPTFGASRTFRIRFGWIPEIKDSTGDTLDTPDEYILDLVNRMVHFAESDAGVEHKGFETEYAVRLGEIEELERSRLGVTNETVIRRQRTFSRVR